MGSAQPAGRTLVAGVDSSTQSCKVVIRDADTGELLRTGQAPHPAGTQVDPRAWLTALDAAVFEAGGFGDVSAIGVGAQQHGMVTLDEAGDPVRPAMLWNDLASAGAAADLTAEFGGAAAWAAAVGLVPVASFTATKLRWLRTNEPANAERTAAVCLPHDWLTWQLGGARGIDTLTTDRSDVSGTAYWSPDTGYRDDLLDLAFGGRPVLPRVLGPHDAAAETSSGARLSPGAGDNAASALGLGARPGDVIVSIGTSGVACAVSEAPTRDPSGTVAGFSDATGRYLPLIATVNAARVLDATAKLLGVNHEGLAALALQAPSGCGGLVLVPYLEGERTPDRPRSTGSLHGLRLDNIAPSYLARAAVEGLLCGLADALDALRGQGVELRRILLIGGAARSAAVRALAPVVFGYPVLVPEPGNHVADGAARQAAWLLRGGDEAPPWAAGEVTAIDGTPDPRVRDRYREARDLTLERLG